jgi:hypothetical protein
MTGTAFGADTTMKRTIAAVTAAAFLLAGPSLASALVCIVGIFAAAAIVAAKEKRELTAKEAWSCGLLLGRDKEGGASSPRRPRRHPPGARRNSRSDADRPGARTRRQAAPQAVTKYLCNLD